MILPSATVVTFALATAVGFWTEQGAPQLPCTPTIQFQSFDDSIYPFGAAAVTDTATCTIIFNTKYEIQGSDGSWLWFCQMMIHEVGHLYGYPDETTDPANIEYYGQNPVAEIPIQCYQPPLEPNIHVMPNRNHSHYRVCAARRVSTYRKLVAAHNSRGHCTHGE